jgi:ADP-ribose pyrophosphatase YjhB (NUDIX family)
MQAKSPFQVGSVIQPMRQLFETALREAQEEIDLQPHHVQVVGELGLFTSRVGM